MPDAPDIDEGLADGTYTEALDPPLSGGVDDMGEYVNATYYVPFEHRHGFIQNMVQSPGYGGGSAPPSSSPGTWTTNNPYQRPDLPGLYAFGCTWRALGTLEVGSSPITLSDVRMTVQFRTPMWPIGGSGGLVWDPQSIGGTIEEQQALLWATQDVDSSVEYIERPQGQMYLMDYPAGGDFTPYSVAEPVPVSISDILITYQYVPYYPSFLESLKGTINDRTFLGCGIGELLFVGYKTGMKSWVGGVRTRTVSLHLRKRPNGVSWNDRLGPDGNWYLLVNSDDPFTAEGTFDLGDFRQLLLLG